MSWANADLRHLRSRDGRWAPCRHVGLRFRALANV